MAIMLAQRAGEYFLAAFAPHIAGCNLSSPRKPLTDADKFHLWNGHLWVWSQSPLDGTIFYPEIRYSGMRVYPWNGWHPKSPEPLLQCLLDPTELKAASTAEAKTKVDKLIADGWEWNWREGGLKYIHVDALEKIEGLPSVAPF